MARSYKGNGLELISKRGPDISDKAYRCAKQKWHQKARGKINQMCKNIAIKQNYDDVLFPEKAHEMYIGEVCMWCVGLRSYWSYNDFSRNYDSADTPEVKNKNIKSEWRKLIKK